MEKVWLSYSKGSCLRKEDSWTKGVQEFYDGCRTATRLFRGKAFAAADVTVTSLEQFITKLIEFSHSNSTIVTDSSIAILKIMSRNNNLTRSSMNIIIEFEKVFPIGIKEFNAVVKKLSKHIGGLACIFKNAVSDFGKELSKFMAEFLRSCRLFNCKRKVHSKCVFEKYQKLTSIVARIDDTLLNECEGGTSQEVYDSILILHLVHFYMGLSVTGVNSCVLDVLYDRECYVSKSVESSTVSIGNGMLEILQAISAVVLTSTKSINDLMKAFVDVDTTLNGVAKNDHGMCDDVLTTVGKIALKLVKGDTVFANKGTKEQTNGILKPSEIIDGK